MKLDASKFEGELHLIKEFLLSKDIQETENYRKWYAYYVKIYGKKYTNFELFTI